MTKKRITRRVVYSAIALAELDEISNWNEQTYSPAHAERYIDFLTHHIDSLGANAEKGKILTGQPHRRYLRIQRNSKGHGHIAVYSVTETEVEILHVFHSAQNWRAKFEPD
jgi:plasmid stabilization system protein ParE